MGCSQAVRHGVLIPAFPGSNPGTPAILESPNLFYAHCFAEVVHSSAVTGFITWQISSKFLGATLALN